jgi:catecholate siderophore receptor
VLGGGATYQAATAVNNPANAMTPVNKVPQFWRFDAFASYALPQAEFQLNVANLTDELYYEQASGSQAVPACGYHCGSGGGWPAGCAPGTGTTSSASGRCRC